jgi:hypothetical protein
MTRRSTANALTTPGTARANACRILFRDLMRLNKRKTRKARRLRSSVSGPSLVNPTIDIMPIVTTCHARARDHAF